MLYFPQLSSGTVCQFPVKRRARFGTIGNKLPGGDSIRMSDRGAGSIHWQLQYSGLSNDEWSAIENLFAAAEGRLNTFSFVDPTDNLLMWSEDWTKQPWTADALVQLANGIADPFGGSAAVQITNTAQTSQRVVQAIAAASWFQYCFSVYLRSDAHCMVQLTSATQDQESSTTVSIGPAWVRVARTGTLASQEDQIRFGLELPAGARVEAYGVQVEGQAAPGYYKRTRDRAGVYSETRFDSDSLTVTTESPNQNSCVVMLVSNLT